MQKSSSGPKGGATTVAPSGQVRTTIYLDPDCRQWLREVAFENELTMSEVIRDALDAYRASYTGENPRETVPLAAVREVVRDHLALDEEHAEELLRALREDGGS